MLNRIPLPYILFSATALLFAASLFQMAFVFYNWGEEVDLGDVKVEVSLPIINWEKYNELSDKLETVPKRDYSL